MAELVAPTSDAIAEFELTPEMVSNTELPAATLDLDAGLEAALEDLGKDSPSASSLSGVSADALQFDVEPTGPIVEAVAVAEAPLSAELLSETKTTLIEEDEPIGDFIVELIEE